MPSDIPDPEKIAATGEMSRLIAEVLLFGERPVAGFRSHRLRRSNWTFLAGECIIWPVSAGAAEVAQDCVGMFTGMGRHSPCGPFSSRHTLFRDTSGRIPIR